MGDLLKNMGYKPTSPKKFDTVASAIKQAEQDLAAERLREMLEEAERAKAAEKSS